MSRFIQTKAGGYINLDHVVVIDYDKTGKPSAFTAKGGIVELHDIPEALTYEIIPNTNHNLELWGAYLEPDNSMVVQKDRVIGWRVPSTGEGRYSLPVPMSHVFHCGVLDSVVYDKSTGTWKDATGHREYPTEEAVLRHLREILEYSKGGFGHG